MKVNDLSIGDWVCAKMVVLDGEERLTPPMRIVQLGYTWAYLLIDPESGDPDEYSFDELRPVPVTRELLGANGFEQQDGDTFRYREKNRDGYWTKEVTVTFHAGDSRFVWVQAERGTLLRRYITGVHELQQLLRMAGLDKDLAL